MTADAIVNRILIIEDNLLAATVYRSTLARAGYQVEVAADGEAGLAAVARSVPDLIVLDMMLPKLDGIEVLRHIRAEHPSLPVIVTSNAYTSERVDALWGAGVTMLLTKANSTPKEFLQTVQQALAGTKRPS